MDDWIPNEDIPVDNDSEKQAQEIHQGHTTVNEETGASIIEEESPEEITSPAVTCHGQQTFTSTENQEEAYAAEQSTLYDVVKRRRRKKIRISMEEETSE